MKKLLLIIGLTLLLSSKGEAAEYVIKSARSISSKGVCFAKVANDKVKISIKVLTNDKESAEIAFNKTKASFSDFEEYINSLNIPGIELETGAISIREDKKYNKETRNYDIIGYKAEIITDIILPMTEKEYMGVIITKASTYTGIYLDSFSMYVSPGKLEEAKTECLGEAIKDALMKAEIMAEAGEARVEKLLQASNEIVAIPKPYFMEKVAVRAMAMSDASGSTPMSIHSKDEEVKVEVQTTWQIR